MLTALPGQHPQRFRTSVGTASGTAPGVPLNVRLQLVNTNGACVSLAGYAIYLWHCTRDGLYSMYSVGVTGENFLRGVQVTDGDGIAIFKTIFPGCYAGRMPHIHFEVYRNANTATSYSNKLRTSQIAFPVQLCQRPYSNAAGYEASVTNLSRVSFAIDMVFSDGVTTQLATMGGNGVDGTTATLQVGISV